MTTITYIPVNIETGNVQAGGQQFDNENDAWIASLTDGQGRLERDNNGYMRAVENGKQVFTGGSFAADDQAAKAETMANLGRELPATYSRYSTLKVERNAAGEIVSVDDDADPELIEYWKERI